MGLLSEAQRGQYRSQGYVVVEDLLSPADCVTLNRHAEAVVMEQAPMPERCAVWLEPDAEAQGLVRPENRYQYLFKIGHQMHMSDALFQRYALHPALGEVLGGLLGPDIKCVQSMFLDKPAGLGVGQPYHQDAWYLKTNPDTLMAVWIACDDAEVENGCLHVVPGSQADPIHPHEKPLDPLQQRIYVEVHSARQRAEIAVPLKAGSAVFFNGHVLHRSGHNHSGRRRRAYALHYADARSKWLNDPAAINPFLLVRGREYPGCL